MRVFGIFSITGGSFIAFMQPWLYFDPHSFVAAYFYLLGLLATAIGLIGLYLYQQKALGGFGFFSFLLFTIGIYQLIGYHWFQTFVYPNLLKSIPTMTNIMLPSMVYGKNLALYSCMVGCLLFTGISLWKGTFSRFGLVFLFLAPFMTFIPYVSIASTLLAGISFVYCGIVLCKSHIALPETEAGLEEGLKEKKLEANH